MKNRLNFIWCESIYEVAEVGEVVFISCILHSSQMRSKEFEANRRYYR